jgi:DNA-binding response OmpR family regulator
MGDSILLVEDDEALGELIAKELRRWNFEAARCLDFDAVMESFEREAPKLVVMDVNLPRFDGYHWCRKIREVSRVPILFISARSNSMDIVMACGMGADDYLPKPFSMDVLVAKIQALLRRAYSYAEPSAEAIVHGDLTLNVVDSSILVGEEREELSPNELRIMLTLLRRKGNLVSREDLMHALWSDSVFVDDNTLTVNVTRLRKKLEALGKGELIRTRKGSGYVID